MGLQWKFHGARLIRTLFNLICKLCNYRASYSCYSCYSCCCYLSQVYSQPDLAWLSLAGSGFGNSYEFILGDCKDQAKWS